MKTLTPLEHIEAGNDALNAALWAGNTPQNAAFKFAAATAHYAAATAKLTLAAEQRFTEKEDNDGGV